jgi:hypothetical protein
MITMDAVTLNKICWVPALWEALLSDRSFSRFHHTDLAEMSGGELRQQRKQAEDRLAREKISEPPSHALSWLTARVEHIDQHLAQSEQVSP